jgi:sodium/proline symporter
MEAQTQILLVMFGYLALMISWGIYQGRHVKTDSDFSIAGRNLPGWAAALSERAAGESSWALLGLPGAAYATGLLEIWTAIGCVAGIVTAWALLSWRLRNEAEKYDIHTFTDYLAKKFGSTGKWIRIVGSMTIAFFFFFYVGAQFLGGGKTLFTLFDIKPQHGMLLMAVIVVPYTIYGGFRSVAYTDVIQAIIMIITLVFGPIAGLIYLSNHPELPFFAHSMSEALTKAGSSYSSLTGGASGFAAGIIIVAGFAWFFGYLGGQPQLSMRFMAIKNMKHARKARNIGIVWTLFAYIGALSLGWIGIAIFGPHGLQDQEFVMPRVIMEVFPPAIAGLLITGIIAAIISTADSLLLVSSTELSDNIIKPAFKKPLSRKQGLALSRLITALLAVIALGMAYLSPSRLIFTMVSYVWAGIGGTFSVVILLALFWKKYHGRAVIVTISTGMVFTIIWISTGMEKVITSRLLTFFVTALAAIVSTYLLPEKQKQSNSTEG